MKPIELVRSRFVQLWGTMGPILGNVTRGGARVRVPDL
jgi:hypothetical protein